VGELLVRTGRGKKKKRPSKVRKNPELRNEEASPSFPEKGFCNQQIPEEREIFSYRRRARTLPRQRPALRKKSSLREFPNLRRKSFSLLAAYDWTLKKGEDEQVRDLLLLEESRWFCGGKKNVL